MSNEPKTEIGVETGAETVSRETCGAPYTGPARDCYSLRCQLIPAHTGKHQADCDGGKAYVRWDGSLPVESPSPERGLCGAQFASVDGGILTCEREAGHVNGPRLYRWHLAGLFTWGDVTNSANAVESPSPSSQGTTGETSEPVREWNIGDEALWGRDGLRVRLERRAKSRTTWVVTHGLKADDDYARFIVCDSELRPLPESEPTRSAQDDMLASAWPIRDVVLRLANFADDRLTRKDFDGDGHEALRICVNQARAWLMLPVSESEPEPTPTFERELATIINRLSLEDATGTPDFILAKFLTRCMSAWNETLTDRADWTTGGKLTDGDSPVPSADSDSGLSAERALELAMYFSARLLPTDDRTEVIQYLRAYAAQCTDIDATIQQHEQTIAEQAVQIRQHEETITELKHEYRGMEAERDATIAEQKATIERRNSAIDQLWKRNGELYAENERLTRERDAKAGEYESAHASRMHAEKALAAAESRIAELERGSEINAYERAALKERDKATDDLIAAQRANAALLSTIRWTVERCELWRDKFTGADDPTEHQAGVHAAAQALLPRFRAVLEGER